MDKIGKFLRTLDKKTRAVIALILLDIRALNLNGYDIKSLQDKTGMFRLRKDAIRIVFVKIKEIGIVIAIAYRKDIYK